MRDQAQRIRLASERVRSVIDRLYADDAMPDAEVRHTVRTVSISRQEGEALTRWVLRERAARTIEIGLGFGVAALHICDGLIRSGDPRARHVALDPFQAEGFADRGLRALEEAGVAPMVEFHAEPSQTALPAFLKEGREFDLAFVDGNHRFEAVFLDLYYLGRLLPKGRIILLDDYDLPGVRRAVSFYLNNLAWQIEETSAAGDPHVWVALRTATAEDTRDFRHFVDF